MADLHHSTALVAYGHIFPPDAPPLRIDDVRRQWEDILAAPASRPLVACEGTVVLGVAVANTAPDPARPSTGELARLYVHPDRWAAGIGRALHDRVVEVLAGLGLDEAELWVLEGNTRARGWYERLGWVHSGARKTLHPGVDDLRYRIALRP